MPEGCEVTCTQVRREPGDTKRVLPAEFPVGSLGHVGVRLRTILLLRSREEGDEIVVWHETLPGEARGPWFTVAVDRFRWALAYRFLDLCANESSLGPDEIHELEMLREYMEERP